MRRIRAKVTRNTIVYERVERLSPESKALNSYKVCIYPNHYKEKFMYVC